MHTGRLYYGWVVLGASALCELLIQGATSYAAGLFVLPLQAQFHISRADASSGILILFLGAALLAPLAGRLLDRWPVRLVVPVGALLFGAALAVIAMTDALWLMALALLVPAALGFMMAGPLSTSTLAARWFYRRRGLALGLAAIATSAGGLVVVPLLARAIAAFGWRTALLWEAALLCGTIMLVALLFLRDRPASLGLAVHDELVGADAAPAAVRLSWRAILGRRAFWAAGLGLVVASGTSQALVVTIVPYGVQLGVPMVSAAFYVSAFALSAAVTKIVAGLLADRVGLAPLMMAAGLFLVLSQLLLLALPSHSGLLAASCLGGVALGWALPVSAAMLARDFGPAAFGSVMGWLYSFVLVYAIVATRLAGAIFDATHGYAMAFAAFLFLALLSLGATFALTRRRA